MKILLSILFWVFWIALIYIANSIYYVDFNIKNWDEEARYVLAFIGVFMGFFLFLFLLLGFSEVKNKITINDLKNSLE